MYNGCRIASDRLGSWTFSNDIAGNFIILDVDDSSLSQEDDWKNKYFSVR